MKRTLLIPMVVFVTAAIAAIQPALGWQTPPDSYAIRFSAQPDSALRVVNRLLKEGVSVFQADAGFSSNGSGFDAGDFIIAIPDDEASLLDDVQRTFASVISHMEGVPLHPLAGAFSAIVRELEHTRVGVYFGEGTSGGALWHIGPAERAAFDVAILSQSDLGAGDFRGADVITFPSGGFYSGYIGEVGNQAVRDFVADGNGFLGTCGGSVYGVELGLLDVALDMEGEWPAAADLRGPIRLSNEAADAPLMRGIDETWTPNYWIGQNFAFTGPEVLVLSRYLDTTPEMTVYDPAISRAYGYFPNVDIIERFFGRPAIVTGAYGAGTVALSGVHPEYAPETQRFYLNALIHLRASDPFVLQGSDLPPAGPIGAPPPMGDPALPGDPFSPIVDLAQLVAHTQAAISQMSDLASENEAITDGAGEFLMTFLYDARDRAARLSLRVAEMGALHGMLAILRAVLAAHRHALPPSLYDTVVARITHARSALAGALRDLAETESLLPISEIITQDMVSHRNALLALLALRDQEGESPAFYEGVIDLYSREAETLHLVKLEIETFLLTASQNATRAVEHAVFTELLVFTVLRSLLPNT